MSNLHNELKNATGHAFALRRMFGGQNDLVVERLSETLQAVVNPYEHPYCSIYRGEVLWARNFALPATVGELTQLGISNPVGSGRIWVVEKAQHRAAVSQTVSVGWAPTQAAAEATLLSVTNPSRRDSRYRAIAVPTVRFISGSDVATLISGADLEEQIIGASFTDFVTTPWIICPGECLILEGATLNTAFSVNLSGTDRPALEGELSS